MRSPGTGESERTGGGLSRAALGPGRRDAGSQGERPSGFLPPRSVRVTGPPQGTAQSPPSNGLDLPVTFSTNFFFLCKHRSFFFPLPFFGCYASPEGFETILPNVSQAFFFFSFFFLLPRNNSGLLPHKHPPLGNAGEASVSPEEPAQFFVCSVPHTLASQGPTQGPPSETSAPGPLCVLPNSGWALPPQFPLPTLLSPCHYPVLEHSSATH